MSAYLRAWKIDVSNKDTIKFLASKLIIPILYGNLTGGALFLDIILKTIRYTYKLMTSKASEVVAKDNNAVCNISESSTTW